MNMDRAQLMALDNACADDAKPWRHLVSSPHLDHQGYPYTPAANTETQPNSDGVRSMIASRCKRLQHSNNVQRLRYLTVHRILSKEGDH